MVTINSTVCPTSNKYVKLPAHRAGLPGHEVASKMRANEISFFIVPLDPAYKAGLAGHLPAKKRLDPSPPLRESLWFSSPRP